MNEKLTLRHLYSSDVIPRSVYDLHPEEIERCINSIIFHEIRKVLMEEGFPGWPDLVDYVKDLISFDRSYEYSDSYSVYSAGQRRYEELMAIGRHLTSEYGDDLMEKLYTIVGWK